MKRSCWENGWRAKIVGRELKRFQAKRRQVYGTSWGPKKKISPLDCFLSPIND